LLEGGDILHVEGSVDPSVTSIRSTPADARRSGNGQQLARKAERTARSGDKESIARAAILKKAKTALRSGQACAIGEFEPEEKS